MAALYYKSLGFGMEDVAAQCFQEMADVHAAYAGTYIITFFPNFVVVIA